MFNLFNLLRLNKERLTGIKKNKPQEIRKEESKTQSIIYNTDKGWLRVQNFHTNSIEVIYYLKVNEANHDELSIKRFIINTDLKKS